MRGLAGEQLDDVDAERLRAVIEEGKGEVALSILGGEVFLGGKAGLLRHLRDRNLHNFPQRTDPHGNFL